MTLDRYQKPLLLYDGMQYGPLGPQQAVFCFFVCAPGPDILGGKESTRIQMPSSYILVSLKI